MAAVKDGLIDTSRFIRQIEQALGHKPVWAVQGKPHVMERRRPGAPTKNPVSAALRERREMLGRHLIVAADNKGSATVLLNSHTVRRKAWIAAGFYRSGEQPLLLIGAALPLQRWRPLEALEELERYRPVLLQTRRAMIEHAMSPSALSALASRVSRTAYLPGHKPISPGELSGVDVETLYGALFAMLARMMKGNLSGADTKRRVKPMRGPDALMHAGNAVFNAGIEMLPGILALPVFRKT